MRKIALLALLFAFASFAEASEPWRLAFPKPSERKYFGHDVVAVLNFQNKQVATVSIEKVPVTGPLPRTEAEWQDFVVSRVHNGHAFQALRKVLLRTPRTAFVSETSYMDETDARIEKLMAVVIDSYIYVFKINDLPQFYNANNTRYYKSLYQDVAFGRNEELLRQLVAGTANTDN